MSISPHEAFFLSLLPRNLTENNEIMSTDFHWHAYGEEWQVESLCIEDYPVSHKKYLDGLLLRKTLIYIHARAHINAIRKIGANVTKSTTALSRLQSEIEELKTQREKLFGRISLEPTSAEKEKKPTYTESVKTIEELINSRDRMLVLFYNYQERRAELHNQLMVLEEEIGNAIARLKGNFPNADMSDYFAGQIERQNITEQPGYPLTSENMVRYFLLQLFQNTWCGGASETERSLREILRESYMNQFPCQKTRVNVEEWLMANPPEVIPWRYVGVFSKEEFNIRWTALIQQLQAVYNQKLYLYWQATRVYDYDQNDELMVLLQDLADEISDFEFFLRRLIYRKTWGKKPESQAQDIQDEILGWWSYRIHYLRKYSCTTEPEEVTRRKLAEKIQLANQALIDCYTIRNRNINDGVLEYRDVASEPLSRGELSLMKYVPTEILDNPDDPFGDYWKLHVNKPEEENGGLAREQIKIGKTKRIERMYLIYFYALEYLLSIEKNTALSDKSNLLREELIRFQDEITTYQTEFMTSVSRDIYTVEGRKGNTEYLFEKNSCSYLTELNMLLGYTDGYMAHCGSNTDPRISDYWNQIQTLLNTSIDEIRTSSDDTTRKGIMQKAARDLRELLRSAEEILVHKRTEPGVNEDVDNFLQQVEKMLVLMDDVR